MVRNPILSVRSRNNLIQDLDPCKNPAGPRMQTLLSVKFEGGGEIPSLRVDCVISQQVLESILD